MMNLLHLVFANYTEIMSLGDMSHLAAPDHPYLMYIMPSKHLVQASSYKHSIDRPLDGRG